MEPVELPVVLAQLRDTEEAKVGDDDLAVLQEDVLRLEVLVDDASGVQVAHALSQKESSKADQSTRPEAFETYERERGRGPTCEICWAMMTVRLMENLSLRRCRCL